MCVFAAVLQDLHLHLALSTADFFCILHVKLLQTNDERPFTKNTWIQESEQCKAKLCSLPVGADVRWGMKKQHWLRICFAISLWYKTATWFERRKDDQCITFQACYLPAGRAACLAFGFQDTLWAFQLAVHYLVSRGVLGMCCELVLFCHHCYSEKSH